METYCHIVVTTLNRLEYTRECLEALWEIEAGYPWKLTIIDNGSDQEAKEFLLDLWHNRGSLLKEIIYLKENEGIPYAYNLGWHNGPKDYYLKLDNDMVVRREGWLANLIEAADTIKQGGVFGYNVEQQSYHLENIDGMLVRPKKSGNLGGACFLIPKRTFEEFGYWYQFGDKKYGEEDCEMSLRIARAGYLNIYMEDESAFIHLPGGRADLPGEEKTYRLFKDNERARNLMHGSEFHLRMGEIQRGVKLHVSFKP